MKLGELRDACSRIIERGDEAMDWEVLVSLKGEDLYASPQEGDLFYHGLVAVDEPGDDEPVLLYAGEIVSS